MDLNKLLGKKKLKLGVFIDVTLIPKILFEVKKYLTLNISRSYTPLTTIKRVPSRQEQYFAQQSTPCCARLVDAFDPCLKTYLSFSLPTRFYYLLSKFLKMKTVETSTFLSLLAAYLEPSPSTGSSARPRM